MIIPAPRPAQPLPDTPPYPPTSHAA
jgi:hypothetical protein